MKKRILTGDMPVQEKTYLYIDGTNLFAGQNELFGPKKFLPFTALLKEINHLFRVDRSYFYCSYMVPRNRSRQETILISNEAQFYRQARGTSGVVFYKGHRSPASGKEKGVDVHLAVDIVRHAFQKECRRAVILTGDADLVYPLEIAKNLGLSVHALFLPNRFSLAIAHLADTATVLNYLNKFRFIRGKKEPRKLKILAVKRPRM